MKIVILGAHGQLGSEFQEFLKEKEEVYAFPRQEMDVRRAESVVVVFRDIVPDVVLNCAAYTRVDQAEEEKEECFRVNALGARNVAWAAYQVKAKVVYVSTDYVFDGKRSAPYTEFDMPNPLSVYGRSKLWGEYLTKDCNPNHLILRTSWLYGKAGHNFIKTIVGLAREKRELRVVDDQKGVPTWTKDLVRQTMELLWRDRVGLYHCANIGETSWFHFARKVLGELRLDARIIPIRTEEYEVRAERPRYSVLANYCLQLEGLNLMRPWEEALGEFLEMSRQELLHG